MLWEELKNEKVKMLQINHFFYSSLNFYMHIFYMSVTFMQRIKRIHQRLYEELISHCMHFSHHSICAVSPAEFGRILGGPGT